MGIGRRIFKALQEKSLPRTLLNRRRMDVSRVTPRGECAVSPALCSTTRTFSGDDFGQEWRPDPHAKLGKMMVVGGKNLISAASG